MEVRRRCICHGEQQWSERFNGGCGVSGRRDDGSRELHQSGGTPEGTSHGAFGVSAFQAEAQHGQEVAAAVAFVLQQQQNVTWDAASPTSSP